MRLRLTRWEAPVSSHYPHPRQEGRQVPNVASSLLESGEHHIPPGQEGSNGTVARLSRIGCTYLIFLNGKASGFFNTENRTHS